MQSQTLAWGGSLTRPHPARPRIASLASDLRSCSRAKDADALRGQLADLTKVLAAVEAAAKQAAGAAQAAAKAEADELRRRVAPLEKEAAKLAAQAQAQGQAAGKADVDDLKKRLGLVEKAAAELRSGLSSAKCVAPL